MTSGADIRYQSIETTLDKYRQNLTKNVQDEILQPTSGTFCARSKFQPIMALSSVDVNFRCYIPFYLPHVTHAYKETEFRGRKGTSRLKYIG
jgi:hypothetical protein